MEELIKAMLALMSVHGYECKGVESTERTFKALCKAPDGATANFAMTSAEMIKDPYQLAVNVRPAALEAPALVAPADEE